MLYLIIIACAMYAILMAVIAMLVKELNKALDNLDKAYKEVDAGRLIGKDLVLKIEELTVERDRYRQACIKSDEIRKKLMGGAENEQKADT